MKRWFANIAGELVGPLTGPEIKAMALAGKLLRDTPVQLEGDANWHSACTIAGFVFPDSVQPTISVTPPVVKRRSWISGIISDLGDSFPTIRDYLRKLRSIRFPVIYVTGWLEIIYGIWMVYGAETFDTTVPSGDGDRVYNNGLMQIQMMKFQAGMCLILIGSIVGAADRIRRKLDDMSQPLN